MYRHFIAITALSIVAFTSCKKQNTESEPQTQQVPLALTSSSNMPIFDGDDCRNKGGNCLTPVVVTPQSTISTLTGDLLNGQSPQTQVVFAQHAADFATIMGEELVDAVISGAVVVSAVKPQDNKQFLLFKKLDNTTVRVLPVLINPQD